MSKTNKLYVKMDDEQYEELKRIKKKHGLTWKGCYCKANGGWRRDLSGGKSTPAIERGLALCCRLHPTAKTGGFCLVLL
jgi:hypothetical protein